jgi:ABC-2 type transport system ATP-binding protein
MSIEVSHLLKQYDQQKAVNDISFNIHKGEIVGFLGPNGAGKSTTMKIITGYLTQDAGVSRVCGIDVAADPIAVKRKIGYLSESNPLYYEMYVKEYLNFVGRVHQISNLKSQISSVIELTGLQVEQKKKIGQLSKGYKQRVGLAAALIHHPEVLILDEPTTGLDPNQIIEIRNVIKQQGANKTVLFSTHILQEVQAVCNRVIIINKGRIVADDTVDNLQHQSDIQAVTVQFDQAINEDWLKNIPTVKFVDVLPQFMYCLKGTQPETIRKQLLELALNQNLNIISLQTDKQSLERIFKSLTSEN